jgi:hypothetical protein
VRLRVALQLGVDQQHALVGQLEAQQQAVRRRTDLALQSGFQGLTQMGGPDAIQGRAQAAAVLAERRHHARLDGRVGTVMHQHQALRQAVEQRAQCGQGPFRVTRQRAAVAELVGGLDHMLQAAAAVLQLADLLVGADGCGQHRVQTGARQLRLGLVVVDVERAHGLDLGRIAGLAGAQHDADGVAVAVGADEAHQLQTGVVALHHHVEQSHRQVGFAADQLARQRAVVGVQEFERLPLDVQALHRQLGGAVHVGVVVDDQHPPGVHGPQITALGVFHELQHVVVGNDVAGQIGGDRSLIGHAHGRQGR